jgi:hypothetical protein
VVIAGPADLEFSRTSVPFVRYSKMAEIEQGAPGERDLVYRKCGTATFAPRKLAEYVDQIHHAISQSNTWGQFRKLMPSDEYQRFMKEHFDENDEPRPPARAKFDAGTTGLESGDYPPWLAPMMDRWIPRDLLDKYATKEATTLNGDYWEIQEEDADSLAGELRALGYRVTELPNSEFY